MTEQPHKPHRVAFTIQTDDEGRKVLDCRLTMALAYVIEDGDQGFPGIHPAADMIAISARKGLLAALDDIKRDDIREDLRAALIAARGS